MAIVGTNLIFNDQDTSVGASPGMKKLPIAGGVASPRFALTYTLSTGNFAADATSIYWANEANVCVMHIP